jgi:integrase
LNKPWQQREPLRTQGSVLLRGNVFRVRVYAGRDSETGKPVYLQETWPDEAQAEAARDRLVALVDAERASKRKGTFGGAVLEWLNSREDEVQAGALAAETFKHYRNLAEHHVIPVLGPIKVEELERVLVAAAEQLYRDIGKCRIRCGGRMDIEHHAPGAGNARLVRDLAGHQCGRRCKPHGCVRASASMLRKVHGVVTGICAMLDRQGEISADPSPRIKAPKKPQVHPTAPTKHQVNALIEAAFAQDGDWGTIVWLLLVTGARRSEIARSQLKHADFERNRFFIDSTKVDGTTRWVVLDEATMGLLAALRSRIEARLGVAGVPVTGEEYLYSYQADHGKPGSASYFTKRFKDMGKTIGIDTHPHALRHFAATELITGGVDIVSVARRLGHKTPSTTSDLYAAWRPEADRRAATLLSAKLAPLVGLQPGRPARDRSAEQPGRTSPELEQRICGLRQRTGWGCRRIKNHLAAEGISIAESTVWEVLRRHGLNTSKPSSENP